MVCRLRLTRQSWQPEVDKLTPPFPDPSWRFAWKGWPWWQQAAVVKHILRQIGDLELQYYLRLFFLQIISRSVNACTLYNLGDMNVVECATLLRRWLVCSQASVSELRNVNTSTRSKTVKPNFTRRKTHKSRQFWPFNLTKLTKRILLENNCWPPYQIRLVYTHKSSSKNSLILPNCMFSQSFSPTCQYFYTDISDGY